VKKYVLEKKICILWYDVSYAVWSDSFLFETEFKNGKKIISTTGVYILTVFGKDNADAGYS
jgi:hypothetical protein